MSADDAAESRISGRGIHMDFDGQCVLSDTDFDVRAGEVVSLVGASGCGKSTLLRIVAGLQTPTSGEVQIAGSSRMGFVFQDATLLPWRTVYNNVRLPFQLEGRAEPEQAILDTVELVGLSRADLKKRPAMLSGGMRMRVSLARALVTQPDVLLMDEPFAALDDILRQQLNEELLRINAVRACSILFVTHNVQEAVFLSHRVLVMSANPGRVHTEIGISTGARTADWRASAEFASLASEVSGRLREAQS